ncbi:hypothetical protein IP69_15920 [Bosea sp. AAP35]|uniref:hypothetical protein n=1 Tax=Bosea sp. AAP35 TaxID=1523417 RepID=UPI0006B989FD|nr:hypothetical protein [Bosea sp. AAP35]KPF65962.1 hypothetical protein IP69_15920 [Bosea sp. AAP35]
MARDDEAFERRMRDDAMRAKQSRSKAAEHDPIEESWFLSALLGGLAVALLFNTFLGLIPG